jgi:indole-3-glycerol phosphate synthase
VGYLQDIGNWTAGEVARRRETRHFAGAIAGEGLSIIAEVKRASPSEGAIARGYVRVAESGIGSKEDALAAKAAGANAALVGTALMRDPALLQELVGL